MEVWKDVKGYEGLYQVSNFGRIKSLQRIKLYENCIHIKKECLLKQSKGSRGYLQVSLAFNKKKKSVLVHRLIANAFIDNFLNKNQINHKNGIKTDNRIQNLEWVTAKENTNHAHQNGLCRKGLTHKKSKQIKCIKTGIIYESIRDAEQQLNIFNLGSMLNGTRKNYTSLVYANTKIHTRGTKRGY